MKERADATSFRFRMEVLDTKHKRATSPATRHRIEGEMRTLRAEMKKLEEEEKTVDAAAAAWWKETKKRLEEVLGPDPNENDPALH